MLVIALMFGEVVQILAGMTDIRYHETGKDGLHHYGVLWFTVSTAKSVSLSTSIQSHVLLDASINVVYAAFSLMGYLTRPEISP